MHALHTLMVDFLLGTNLGMPYADCIYIAYSRRFPEQLHRREKAVSFPARIAENNASRALKNHNKIEAFSWNVTPSTPSSASFW